MTSAASIRNIARDWRGPARRLTLGLSTLFGIRARGFFVPYRYAQRTTGAHHAYEAITAIFERERPRFRQILDEIESFGDALVKIGNASARTGAQPRWDQDWFPALDGALAYTLVRARRPRRIVEVGSGHSTRFLLRAIEDGGLSSVLTAIDPKPRATVPQGVELRKATIQEAGLSLFATLEAGDFVVIDSSHVLMPGSDVDLIVNAVLPALPIGVYVHFHDVFLPDDYPAEWRWRSYNEQSVVAALLNSGAYAPIFASHYMTTRLAHALAGSVVARLPRLPSARESSLWLVKLPRGTTTP